MLNFRACFMKTMNLDSRNQVKDLAASYRIFDPRGIRQMQEKNIPALGSLLAGIKRRKSLC